MQVDREPEPTAPLAEQRPLAPCRQPAEQVVADRRAVEHLRQVLVVLAAVVGSISVVVTEAVTSRLAAALAVRRPSTEVVRQSVVLAPLVPSVWLRAVAAAAQLQHLAVLLVVTAAAAWP